MTGASFMRRLACNSRGSTMAEFAVVAPVMILTIMGLGDFAYTGFAQSVLDGAVQKAGRDSTLQGGAGAATATDAKVTTEIRRINNLAVATTTRKNFSQFGHVDGERFTDGNSDGVRQTGECYDDVNSNSQFDAVLGSDGQGGAEDATLYEVTVTYPRVFPLYGLLGLPNTQTLKAKTLLKNQPFSTQSRWTVVQRCT